jgi:glycosyltransferase involved in cell wall biosynthesis
MFVYNDATHDSRVLREAHTLQGSGHDVTLVAIPREVNSVVVERETVDGIDVIRVPVPRAWRRNWTWVRWPWLVYRRAVWALPRSIAQGPRGWSRAAQIIAIVVLCAPWLVLRGTFYVALSPWRRPGGRPGVIEWLLWWRLSALAWARAAAAEAGPADVYHGHDLTGLAAAIAASNAHRSAKVVYDSHEIYLESGATADQPAWLRRLMARRERSWIARCAALVTVNESLARELTARYAPARTVVVHNCPPRSDAPVGGPDPLRAAAGIPAGAPVALYHGAYSRFRGLEQLIDAMAEPALDGVHAVFLGYGGMHAELEAMAAASPVAERVHVLPAVPPDELGAWVAPADVGIMMIQPSTINHRMSTPNKLFECLAAGVPVVASDFPEMRQIVCDGPLGPLGIAVAPDDVQVLARAIRAIVTADPVERAELRARCLRAAHERWNWETESAGLVRLYAELTGTS